MKVSNNIYANVHSIETFGAFDGPGIRYVIFLQGCPFQCQYCHNRDTWSTKTNRLMTIDDIFDDYKKYERFYKKGGITVSGGEPLMQIHFLIDLFKEAKKRNIHTCLDTSAACFNQKQIELYDTLLNLTDLVLLDIKHIDLDKHISLTKQSNQHVLQFAQYLDSMSKKMIIRHVLVPGYTDDIEDLKRLRLFLDQLKHVINIEVLPYHNQGIKKWESLGFDYPLKDVLAPTAELISYVEQILKDDYVFNQ